MKRIFLGGCCILLLAPCLAWAEGGRGGKDAFGPEQLRSFAREETLAGEIKAGASLVSYHKFSPDVDKVFDWAFGDLRRVALLFDASRPDSDISRINAEAGTKPVRVSKEMVQILGLAKKVRGLTNGAFDVVIDTGASANDIKVNKGANTVQFGKPGMRIDLNNLIDGYLADLLLVNLWNANIDNALVQVGGAARSTGRDVAGPWRLTIADVAGRYAARGISLSFSNLSAATVGAGKRSPTIDFRTKKELSPSCRGATVLSRDAATSLAIANAVYTLGPTAGMQLAHKLSSRAIIMGNDGNILKSPGL